MYTAEECTENFTHPVYYSFIKSKPYFRNSPHISIKYLRVELTYILNEITAKILIKTPTLSYISTSKLDLAPKEGTNFWGTTYSFECFDLFYKIQGIILELCI
jgi:hypothetical protein